MAHPTPYFFHSAEQLLTLAGKPVPRRGRDLEDLGIIRGGATLVSGGTISAVGRTSDLKGDAKRMKARAIDCAGKVVMPGFVDSHTHLVFAGTRVEEFEQRSHGLTSEQIRSAGGGIQRSARLLREASPEALVAQGSEFLKHFAAHGTTTVEVKSGYGLDPENEIKMLEVIRKLRQVSPLDIVPTLLAAHALPAEFEDRREAYVERMVRELIPQAAQRNLAEFIDCFCDRGAFTVAECRELLEAGARHGLVPRIHADQFRRIGAIPLAIEMNAASADHLDHLNEKHLRLLARSNVVAILIPGANFFLGTGTYAPARRLIDAGAAIAVATDFNPGTSPTLNMQFVLTLACTAMHMTPAESVAASTINAAHSLRRADRCGSLEPGKQADFCVMDVDDYRLIPYFFGRNHCVMTVKRGQIIYPPKAES